MKKSYNSNFNSQDLKNRLLGLNIRHYRIKANLSVEDTAKQLGISAIKLLQYEVGVREILASELNQLSSIFQTPINKFYTDFELIDA